MTAAAYAGELLPAVPDGGEVSAGELDTLTPLLAGWLVSLIAAKRSPHTRAAYEADVRGWVAYCRHHDVDPVRATKRDVDGWQATIAETPTARTGRPPAAASVARRVAALASWFGYLADEGHVDGIPIRAGSRPKVSKRSTTVGLSREEAQAVEQRLAVECLRDRAVILLLLHGGLRVGELTGLDVGAVVMEQGQVVARVHGKGDQPRTVPLSGPTYTAVSEMLDERAAAAGVPAGDLDQGAPLVEADGGGRYTQRSIMRIVQRVARAAGVPSWRSLSPHSLRHTCATQLLNAGVPINVVSEYLGHEDIRTTQRYDREREALSRKAAAVHSLAAWLDPGTSYPSGMTRGPERMTNA